MPELRILEAWKETIKEETAEEEDPEEREARERRAATNPFEDLIPSEVFLKSASHVFLTEKRVHEMLQFARVPAHML